MSRQAFGQHFLISEKVLRRIAGEVCRGGQRSVVEIGPGRGALTGHLLECAERVIAAEIDPEMVRALDARFPNEPRLTVLHGDALEMQFEDFSPSVICGNLPYYVATPILERAARSGVRGVFLIQKEVAERVTANPGSRAYGFLTCAIALFARAQFLFGVKPGAFRPPPKVDSAVIALEPQNRAAQLGIEPEPFLRFLSQCFAHKRKTLRNNLNAPIKAGHKRAEQCSMEELAEAYRELRGIAGTSERLGEGAA